MRIRVDEKITISKKEKTGQKNKTGEGDIPLDLLGKKFRKMTAGMGQEEKQKIRTDNSPQKRRLIKLHQREKKHFTNDEDTTQEKRFTQVQGAIIGRPLWV